MAIPYYHVDAFTSELFAGNPGWVCITNFWGGRLPQSNTPNLNRLSGAKA